MHVNIHIDTSKVNLGKRLFINAYTHKMTSTLAYQNKQTTNKQIHTTCSHGSCGNTTAAVATSQPCNENQTIDLDLTRKKKCHENPNSHHAAIATGC